MRSHCCRMLMLATALVVMAPRTADAGLLEWLGRLSGPGPFWGLDANVCLKSFPLEERERDRKDMVPMATIRLSCPGARLEQRHISWYVNFGWALASENPLDYTGVDVSDKSQRVWLLKLGTSWDLTLTPSVDVGVGGGLLHFGGERFDGFTRPYIEPARVAIRPLLLRRWRDPKKTERDGWLLVSASWIIHLGTLDGPSFGAPFDTYRTYNENNWTAGLTVDVLRLLRK